MKKTPGAFSKNKYVLTCTSFSPSGTLFVDAVNGRVGIGTRAPAMRLTVASTTEGNVLRLSDGTETCDLDPDSTAVTETCSSDERLKENIRDAAPVLPFLTGIPIRDFRIRASGEEATGVVAQELLAMGGKYGKMVVGGEDGGMYSVRSVSPWVVIKGLQELEKRVRSLEAETTTQFGEVEPPPGGSNSILAQVRDAVRSVFAEFGFFIENGIAKFREFTARKITVEFLEANEVRTSKLCVGATCVTETELKMLLDRAGVTAATQLNEVEPPLEVQPQATTTVQSGEVEPPLEVQPQAAATVGDFEVVSDLGIATVAGE